MLLALAAILSSIPDQAFAATKHWDGGALTGGPSWNTPSNWDGPDLLPNFSSPGDDIIFDNAATSGTSTGLDGSKTINSLTFSASDNANFAILAGTTANSTLTITTGNLSKLGNGAPQIFAGVVLGASGTWNIANTVSSLTVSGVISDGGNGYGITFSGPGRTILTGANTYSGLTIVSAGTLTLNANSGAAIPGNLEISGGTVSLPRGNQIADSRTVTVSGGILDLQANSDTVGPVVLKNGSITASSGTLTGSSFDVQNGSITAKLAGAGASLNKTSAGTVTLSGVNTYSGGTVLTTGILKLGVNNAIPNAGLTFAGGTLEPNNFSDALGALSLTSGSSIIKLDPTGNAANLSFTSVASGAGLTLTIDGWHGTTGSAGSASNDRITFASDPGAAFRNAVSWTSVNGSQSIQGALYVGDELVPVPEPANVALAIFGGAFLGFGVARRAWSHCRRQALTS